MSFFHSFQQDPFAEQERNAMGDSSSFVAGASCVSRGLQQRLGAQGLDRQTSRLLARLVAGKERKGVRAPVRTEGSSRRI